MLSDEYLMTPPTVRTTFEELPFAPAERAQAAVELLGQHLFSLRNQRVDSITRLLESADDRGRLGKLRRKAYDDVAALSPEAQQAALALARTAIDLYLQDLLTLLGNRGNDLSLGTRHAITYELILEVREIESGEVAEQFAVNREGSRFLGDYYGRWLNRYHDHR
jgi:hypothetical protein